MDDRRIISFDWAVKRMLRDKANFAVLEGLFKVLIGHEMRIVEILESEGNQEDATDKFNRVDVKAKDENGEIIIVEVQVTRQIHYLERILYGVSKAITEHIRLGEAYNQVKKVYSINILYFNLGEGTDYLYHGTTQFVGVHTKKCLTMTKKERDALGVSSPTDVFPEYYLIRVNEFNQVATTPLEEWLDYLKNQHISADTTAPGLQEARQKLEVMNMTRAERLAYERHLENLMMEKDVIETAQADGYEQGREETAMKIAQRMLAVGIQPDIVAQTTGITAEQLEACERPTR
jgi:hypothetical protein